MVFISLLFVRCSDSPTEIHHLGTVPTPDDNPTTKEKIELGRKLFFDKRLSVDGTVSCASCHLPELAFTDGQALSKGIFGKRSFRNSPSLLNAGYLETVMFDAHIASLEEQVLVPLTDTVEMGANVKEVVHYLQSIPGYQKAAQDIYQRDFDIWVLTRSIAAFERSLISDNSKYDQWKRGEVTFSPEEQRGHDLFFNELYCTKCHPAPHFTNYQAENNGLYLDYGEDMGRFRIHFDSLDIGSFKVPSLRNIELTAPYMHDGSISTLKGVFYHYASGGKGNNLQDSSIQPFDLTRQKINDLTSFLQTLTDTSYMKKFR